MVERRLAISACVAFAASSLVLCTNQIGGAGADPGAIPGAPLRLSYITTTLLPDTSPADLAAADAAGTTVVGGLSGLDFRDGQFITISDDKSEHGPARPGPTPSPPATFSPAATTPGNPS